MLTLSQLFIYPVKSLGGIAVNSTLLTSRGLEHDRRWMLIDDDNRFISQREEAKMALLRPHLQTDGIQVTDITTGDAVFIPFSPRKQDEVTVTVWDDTCIAQLVSDEIDIWFSRALGLNCRLVYMPDESERQVDQKYAPGDMITSFSDGYPTLIIGQASLDGLNSRLTEPVSIDRFRPNLVFTGGGAHLEDSIHTFIINDIVFYGVKLCARCSMTIINQETARKGKEPMKTLATYRFKNNKILFGQNLIHKGEGTIAIGDTMVALEYHTEDRFIVPDLTDTRQPVY